MPSLEADVLVVGGGSAGIAAAITASQQELKVVLLEQSQQLGGMGSLAQVHTFCGLYDIAWEEHSPARFSNSGFSQAFIHQLQKEGAAAPKPTRMGKLDVLFHDPRGFSEVAKRAAISQPNLRVLYGKPLSSLKLNDSGDWQAKAGDQEVVTKMVIDTSGDATAIHLFGAETEMVAGDILQRPAIVVELTGVSSAKLSPELRLRLAHAMAKSVKEGGLSPTALGVGFRSALHDQRAFLTMDLGKDLLPDQEYAPLDAHYLQQLYAVAKQEVLGLVDWLRTQIAGWEKVEVYAWPERLGVRETRRARGLSLMSLEDWRATPANEGVAFASWPIELREKATGPKWIYPERGNRPVVPLGALVSRDHPKLWFAGRCVSSSHEVLGSLRVMGTCLATGEAAALACSSMIQHGYQPTAFELPRMAEHIRHIKNLS